jgi:hypothetical protein
MRVAMVFIVFFSFFALGSINLLRKIRFRT